jgi:hypothetical protein
MSSEALHSHDERRICTLLAGCNEPRFAPLAEGVAEATEQIIQADRLSEIGKILRYRRDIPVLICGPVLRDADWQDVASLTRSVSHAPMLLVACERPDAALWAEVLDSGGFGLCIPPWYREKLREALEAANSRWWRQREILQAREQNLCSLQQRRTA